MTATAGLSNRDRWFRLGWGRLGRVAAAQSCRHVVQPAELQTCYATSVLAAPRLTCFSAVPKRVVRACDQRHGWLLAALAALAAAPVQPAPEARAGVEVCPRPTRDTKKNKTCEGGRTKRPNRSVFLVLG